MYKFKDRRWRPSLSKLHKSVWLILQAGRWDGERSLARKRQLKEESEMLQLADSKLYAVHVEYNQPRNSTYYLRSDR